MTARTPVYAGQKRKAPEDDDGPAARHPISPARNHLPSAPVAQVSMILESLLKLFYISVMKWLGRTFMRSLMA